MFRIKPKTVASAIRTIEQEMAQTGARYEKYLRETTNDFAAKRSNVEIRDPHTMAGGSYWELRKEINTLNSAAKDSNKDVLFQDARVLMQDDEFVSPVTENVLSSQILVKTRDRLSGHTDMTLIDRFKMTASEFMKEVIDFINKPIVKP